MSEERDISQMKDISRKFTDLFNSADEALAREILSPEILFHGSSGDGYVRGIEEVMTMISAYQRHFPGRQSVVEAQAVAGDKVVTHWRIRSLEAADVLMDGITVERMEAGKIVEVWALRYELPQAQSVSLEPEAVQNVLRQVGAIPE